MVKSGVRRLDGDFVLGRYRTINIGDKYDAKVIEVPPALWEPPLTEVGLTTWMIWHAKISALRVGKASVSLLYPDPLFRAIFVHLPPSSAAFAPPSLLPSSPSPLPEEFSELP